MAPLVPSILSSEFDFVIAFLVGIAFGFVLEQAGFSSTRKLVGLFYGYDFTVLKVFFTAGITAMLGVIVFSHLGWLNIEMVFINPMFWHSAVTGGLIMGAGFILGGFCPGTSLCAAAVGRIDAMVFILGSLLGIILFTEGYPLWEELYYAGNMGAPRIHDVIGMSEELFGILLTLVALGAFILTRKIQQRVTGEIPSPIRPSIKRNYILAASGAVVVLLIVAFTPTKQERLRAAVEEAFTERDYEVTFIDKEKLAFELINHAHKYNIVNTTDKDSIKIQIPTAFHIRLSELEKQQFHTTLIQPYKRNIYIAEDTATAIKAAIKASFLGDKNPLVLRGTVQDFRQKMMSAEYNVQPQAQKSDYEKQVFYQEASKKLLRMEEKLKNLMKPPKKDVTKAKGGCA